MTIRLGINPIGWTNDDVPWLGDELPLDQVLAEGRAAGFTGFELGRKFPRTAAELGPILDRHELKLASGWYSSRLLERSVADEMESVADHLTLLKELGAKVMVFCESSGDVVPLVGAPMSTRPQLDGAAAWKDLGRKLTEVADRLAEAGVAMTYHHHMGTVVQSEQDIDRLMSATGPSVGLLLDTGHLTYAGGDPVNVAMRWGSRINHVHAKDIRPAALFAATERDASFTHAILMGVFTVPGDGMVDYPGVLAALKAADYSGWIIQEAEQDHRVAPPAAYARFGHAELLRLCRSAGFTVT